MMASGSSTFFVGIQEKYYKYKYKYYGCICTRPANATRTLVLCCTKVESCVAFVDCEVAWCEFGVVMSSVFEVCVSTAIGSSSGHGPEACSLCRHITQPLRKSIDFLISSESSLCVDSSFAGLDRSFALSP